MIKSLVLAIFLLAASAARADAIYSFTGTCLTNCTGIAAMTVRLTAPELINTNFIDLNFTDSSGSLFWNDRSSTLLFKNCHFVNFPDAQCDTVTLPDFNFVDPDFITPTVNIKTHADGTWSAVWETGQDTPPPNPQPIFHRTSGNNGVWLLDGLPLATVPEPPVLALMLFGMLIMSVRRHK